MRILISGVCGFAGTTLARTWIERGAGHTLFGVDNLSRPGSETNRRALRQLGVTVIHGDIRMASDFESLPQVDWVIDAAANPSVRAGVDGLTSSRQLVEHNLFGTVNMLEFCRRHGAGFVLLSTSRVYSIRQLAQVKVAVTHGAFAPVREQAVPEVSLDGVKEGFSTEPPLSLYGATKLASEQMALEYGGAFGFPVWVNRCGLLAGPGQFGRHDQGIFSYWIHSWAARRPLSYIGFDGTGHQVRDCLHPRDLVALLDRQLSAGDIDASRVVNVAGGTASAISLKQCSEWCADRFGAHRVSAVVEGRAFDIPWLVLDSAVAQRQWGWAPETSRDSVFEEIAAHAEAHLDWLDLTQ